MPSGGVTIGLDETGASLQLSSSGENAPPPESTQTSGLRPSRLRTAGADAVLAGRAGSTAASSSRSRKKLGFFDGRPGRHWALNGGIYPDVPMFVVERGDLVRVTIANDTNVVHPMHLHGHHALVLSRNGQPATGSPVVDRHAGRRPRRRVRDRLPCGQPGHLDGSLPQPRPCRSRAHDARCLRGDHDALPRRRRARQRARVGASSTVRSVGLGSRRDRSRAGFSRLPAVPHDREDEAEDHEGVERMEHADDRGCSRRPMRAPPGG